MEERELTRRGDELTEEAAGAARGSRSRRTTASRPRTATKSLADLFDGRSQLLVYHFMFGPAYEAGCPVCSSIADTLAPNVPHLNARDATADLRLPWAAREAARIPGSVGLGDRLGLDAAAATSIATSGSCTPRRSSSPSWRAARCHRTVAPERRDVRDGRRVGYVAEGPGLSVYALADGTVYRTYVTTARGLEGPAIAFYALLDRTPNGRRERGGRADMAPQARRVQRRLRVRRGGAVGEDQRLAAGLAPGRRESRDPGRSASAAPRPSPPGDHPEQARRTRWSSG